MLPWPWPLWLPAVDEGSARAAMVGRWGWGPDGHPMTGAEFAVFWAETAIVDTTLGGFGGRRA